MEIATYVLIGTLSFVAMMIVAVIVGRRLKQARIWDEKRSRLAKFAGVASGGKGEKKYPRVMYWSNKYGWRSCDHVGTTRSGQMVLHVDEHPAEFYVKREPNLVEPLDSRAYNRQGNRENQLDIETAIRLAGAASHS